MRVYVERGWPVDDKQWRRHCDCPVIHDLLQILRRQLDEKVAALKASVASEDTAELTQATDGAFMANVTVAERVAAERRPAARCRLA